MRPPEAIGFATILAFSVVSGDSCLGGAHTPSAASPTTSPAERLTGNSNGYKLQVITVARDLAPGPVTKPAGGDHFVLVEVLFINDSKSRQRPDPLCCQLEDSTGVFHTATFPDAPGCSWWSSVQLATGTRFGPRNICFEAAGATNKPLSLLWHPSYSSPDVSILLQ
jgi:hypothetical protein